jgi:hypothetical protein
LVIEPDSTAELRVLFEGKPPIVRHYKGSDVARMARDAIRLGQGAKGVYFVLNPLPAGWSGGTAKDGDIVRRRWLLVDCDPKRTGTVSSTDAEKALAHEKVFEVATFLETLGWPNPVIADSGNGWHLLYRIDLPADDGGLVARVLKALAARFSDDVVDVDTTVGNASRICKLYGTLAAKGENTSERPHRVSKIDSIPDPLVLVPTELLQKLASEGETPMEPVRRPPSPPDSGARVSRPQAIDRARSYLQTMDPSISGEHGHDKLLKAASVLVNDFDLTDGEALDLLVTDFNPRCVPPWEEAELARKVSEAKKNPPSRTPKGDRKNSPRRHEYDDEFEEAIAVRLSDVQEEPLEWLWPLRIPLGKLTLLAGDPGLGKSFMTIDMAARVSTGRSWPDSPGIPQPVGSVVMFNCEDDVADTVLPRLVKAGGDPAKVIAIQGIRTTDSQGKERERGFMLDQDLPTLIATVEANPDARLLVIDPISAYCGGTDTHKNADVRGMLAPLAAMASKYRVAVVMVTHLSKGSKDKAVYRSMGSLAFAAAARAVWHVAKDHDDPDRRLFLLTKMNVCEESTGLAYRLEDGVVCWEEGSVTMSADDHMADDGPRIRGSTDTGQAVVDAADWLAEKLSDRSLAAVTIQDMAEDEGISWTTMKRAKKKAGVKTQRMGFGKGSVVWWTLPPPESVDEAE